MKNQCTMNCEMKKIFEDAPKYDYYLSMAAAVCAGCIHFKKQDFFVLRKEVEPVGIINKMFNTFAEFCIKGSG